MKTRRKIDRRSKGAAARDNPVTPQVPVEGVVMPINPDRLIDAEVRDYLAQNAQSITMQAQSMTDQVNRQNV